MRGFWVMLKKELRMFFVSPVAYVVLALVMVLNGFAFRAALSILESAPSEGSIVTWTFQPQWFWLSYFFMFPLLTMRSFAEERRLGTFETLFTAPVRAWQVVAGNLCVDVAAELLQFPRGSLDQRGPGGDPGGHDGRLLHHPAGHGDV
jgi:ABC-2 type transport system permease protein